MSEDKRYRTECIVGVTSYFIVDTASANNKDRITSYNSYDTNTERKCEELTELLNGLTEEVEYLTPLANENSEYIKKVNEENKELKRELSSWKSSCGSYINIYSILTNEISILRETRDVDRFLGEYDEYCKLKFEDDTASEEYKSIIELKEENEQLKTQLRKGEDVCGICKYQYLTKRDTDEYYIAKCKKEHEECSKMSLKYCEDFELESDYDD